MYDLFDAFQQGMINDAERKAEYARKDAQQVSDRLHHEVQRLEAKIDGLALISEALWEVVQAHTDITPDEIHEKIKEIDLRDGCRDGKITGRKTYCAGCGRVGHTRQSHCMYCGESLR